MSLTLVLWPAACVRAAQLLAYELLNTLPSSFYYQEKLQISLALAGNNQRALRRVTCEKPTKSTKKHFIFFRLGIVFEIKEKKEKLLEPENGIRTSGMGPHGIGETCPAVRAIAKVN